MELRIQIPLLQMIPEGIHIADVEDKPSPASHTFTLLQIEDRRAGASLVAVKRSLCPLHRREAPCLKHLCKNRTDSVMFTTRRVTAEIFSIVGIIRHEFTLAQLECSFQKAYCKS